MYLSKQSGGLNIVNIEYKLYALRLKHLQDIINNRKVKFVNFSIYWIGYQLRDLNFSLASLSVPHSELVSPFYQKCLKVLNIFKNKCKAIVLGQYNTKTLYNLILDSDEHVIKIVERNVDIDFSCVFNNVFDRFIDKFSRDVIFRIVHEILPVNMLMYKFNISKTYKCVFCTEVETLRHLFFECSFNLQLLSLIKNWIFALSNGKICLNSKNIIFQDIDDSNDKMKSVILLIISMYCKTVWLNRNVKKFEKKNVNSNILYLNFLSQLKLRILADFDRLPEIKFTEYWCNNDLFCNVKNNILNVTFY